jgi:hypothetical protein|tara:strand:- start:508 stop:618 length:111 start_codon:yes stop_codon:yes gene_type:complete
MKDPWLWLGEFIACVMLFAFFYFIIWFVAILFPGAM